MFLGVCLCPGIYVRARHVTIDCERCMRACARHVTMGLRVSDACACSCARHVTIDCERCVRVCLCPCICVRARVLVSLHMCACACACARHVTIDCERCVRVCFCPCICVLARVFVRVT